VQKLSGDAAASSDRLHLDLASRAAGKLRQARRARALLLTFRFAKQGNQGRAKTTTKNTARRETIRMECLGKTCCAATARSAACGKYFLSSFANYAQDFGCGLPLRLRPQTASIWSWRRESNPRPSDYKSDALPTELRQQTGESARLRANSSLGSLPDVRDNYISYHSAKFGCNKSKEQKLQNEALLTASRKYPTTAFAASTFASARDTPGGRRRAAA
jgi:hypothetical protein